jgi:ribosome-binding protein aMBF1 (putative translation factor)
MDLSTESSREESREKRKRLVAECAARLVAARKERGLSPAECADALHIPRSTWSDYESDALPDAVRGAEIEAFLGVARGGIYRQANDLSAANATPAPVDSLDAPAPTVAA